MLRIIYVIILLLNIIHFICNADCSYGKNFLDASNSCQSSCPNYYTFTKYGSDSNGNKYPLYKCLNKCEDENLLYLDGTNECVSSCGLYYKYKNTCYKICYDKVSEAPYSYQDTVDKNVCIDGCPTFSMKSNKVCVQECSKLEPNHITDGKFCVDKCDTSTESENKYLVNESGKFFCRSKCPNLSKRYSKSNYICEKFCTPPNNYVIVTEYTEEDSELVNVCLDKCPENKPYMRQNDEGEYICSNIPCGKDNNGRDSHKYFYMDTYICLKECGSYYYYKDTDDNNK